MDKQLQIVITVCFLVATLSAVYYFLLFLPAQETSAVLSAKQSQCADQAQKALVSEEATFAGMGNSLYGQTNHYNSDMGKCFALLSYANGEYNEALVDAYENTFLASCSYEGFADSSTICFIGPNSKLVDYQQYENFVAEAMQSFSTTSTTEFPYLDY